MRAAGCKCCAPGEIRTPELLVGMHTHIINRGEAKAKYLCYTPAGDRRPKADALDMRHDSSGEESRSDRQAASRARSSVHIRRDF
jgi:hypothetical protein